MYLKSSFEWVLNELITTSRTKDTGLQREIIFKKKQHILHNSVSKFVRAYFGSSEKISENQEQWEEHIFSHYSEIETNRTRKKREAMQK